MKFVVVIGDGMADYPIPELGNRTPLEVANKENMDFLSKNGIVGKAKTLKEGLEAGSDVANLTILGYDPKRFYTGRGPLEAASIGVNLNEKEVAFRCNLITVKDENGRKKIISFNADHITSEEAKELIKALNKEFHEYGRFYSGVGYRNIFVTECCANLKTTPPHDIVGEFIDNHLPKGENAEKISELIIKSQSILEEHEINIKRVRAGKLKANMIWLWGQGKKPKLIPFYEKYGVKGAVISAVDLIKGIGFYARMHVVNVPGATGYYDTSYENKAKYAIKMLENNDFVYIHVEAPDEAGHEGDYKMKIKTIEDIDKRLLGKLLDELPSFNEYRILIMPDHATPVSVRTHTRDPVPYAIYDSRKKFKGCVFSERIKAEAIDGLLLMKRFINF